MEIHKNFKELLELFNAHKVEYVVVGGYALAFHGAPRFTGDIDILVRPDDNNAKRIIAALADFGFASLGLCEADFTKLNNVIQLGVPPVRVDIMTSLTAVTWDKARTGRVTGNYDRTTVYFIGRDDLIANKKALGRKKDIADLEALEQ